MHPDEALEKFAAIFTDHGPFVQTRGRISEADTRANIIDRILHEVLAWPRDAVKREPHSKAGYLDYKLIRGIPFICIEAKAEGETFVIPYRKHTAAQRMKIGGALSTTPEVKAALEQAHAYCAEEGIRFAVVTNGYSFIIFRALTEGESWREGSAIVFSGAKVIQSDFTNFWNLLSYEAVKDGQLTEAFRRGDIGAREFHRPIEAVVDADATYARNPINLALRPYVERFFGDIASQNTIEILRECYVHSRPVQVIDHDLKLIIEDNVPLFASNTTQLTTTPHDQGGSLGVNLKEAVEAHNSLGAVVLLMGGIGSGKTTFLKRFFKVVAPDLFKAGSKTFRIHIDFLGAPDSISDLDGFLWSRTAAALRAALPTVTQRPTLERIFAKRLAIIEQVYGANSPETIEKTSELLLQLAANNREFSLATLNYCREDSLLPLVVFDNVDQLGLELQAHIFTTTEHLAHHNGCLAVLVIREETFSAAQMQKQLTAYTIRPYHLSSPSFRELIRLRLEFATNAASRRRAQGSLEGFKEDQDVSADEILEFFNLLRNSVFSENLQIVKLLEAISFGNMRLALSLFSTFLLSGATNLPKILTIFRESGRYHVPFHEFAKSVILGDYRFYKEARSYAFNIFNVTAARNASHFTALRILYYLSNVADCHQGGDGFVDLQGLVSAFVDTFDNEDDCIKTLLRLSAVNRQLIEFDTRRPDTLAGASSLRISSSGKYYLDHFVEFFAYLDLVWHDTPFSDRAAADGMVRMMHTTDLRERLKRVEQFIAYLEKHEHSEIEVSGIGALNTTLSNRFIPRIQKGFEEGKKDIEKYVNSYLAAKNEPFGQRLNLDGYVAIDPGEATH